MGRERPWSYPYNPFLIKRLLRRDRAIVGIALLILILLAWLYVGRLATSVQVAGMDMTGTRMVSTGSRMVMTSRLQPWSGAEFAFMFLMWAVMMVAMMLPSATPMVLRYARVGRAAALDAEPFGPTGWFAAGYLLVWFGFAFAATGAQWALERAALLTPMASTSNVVGGILLIMAGLYQWSPLKDTCLAHCQDPPALYPILRRLSSQCLGRFGDRRTARRLLCWMLLGVDDVVVRWWRDERVMDRSYCDARIRGENRRRAPRVARSRRCSYRRRLVADATYVRFRSFADFSSRRSRRSMGGSESRPSPGFFTRSRHANVRFGS
jgi:Predicted metal-binding integral membrane protein